MSQERANKQFLLKVSVLIKTFGTHTVYHDLNSFFRPKECKEINTHTCKKNNVQNKENIKCRNMTGWENDVHEEIRQWHDIWYDNMNDSTSTQ